MKNTSSLVISEREQFRLLLRDMATVEDPSVLGENVFVMLELLLRRDEDQQLLRDLSEVVGELLGRIPFDSTPEQIRAGTRAAAHGCIKVLQTAKQKRAAARNGAAQEGDGGEPGGERDLEYWLPPHLAALLARIDYVVPVLPPVTQCASFDDLCRDAIFRRIDNVLVFFQRYNPAVSRELPPLFLFSPEFAAKFKRAVATFIYPHVRDSRQVRVLATSVDLSKTDPQRFWQGVDATLRTKLALAWRAAWERLKLVEAGHENDQRIMQIKTATRALREMLQPDSPQIYDLPKIGNREIDLFSSLLDPETDWQAQLSTEWQRFHDFYEQEMDPRVFQQRAREGVLRDNILAAAQKFPEQWSDFLVLLCHRVFPRVNASFIESFVTSIGRDVAERERRAPYLMRYLGQLEQHPHAREVERCEEEQWKEKIQELRVFLKGFV